MSQPVKSICTPTNIYGPIQQTLFLGLSVQSFSVSVGWNEEISELTVQLVEDNCIAPAEKPKYYWDENLTKQSTTAVDPGFIPGVDGTGFIGAPVYFRVDADNSGDLTEGFEFSGILQSFQKHENASAYPTYTAKVVSPQEILRGVQLIIGEYAGSTAGVGAYTNVPNLYNCFGFMESFGEACADYTHYGVNFGTLAGGFNGAQVNDNGMPWNYVLQAFNMMCNGIGIGLGGDFAPDLKRVQFRGGSNQGYGFMPGNPALYYVDISELAGLALPNYYRFSGAHIGLLDAISQVCRDSGYDYYVELLPIITDEEPVLDASGIAKFIKIRVANRQSNPTGVGFILDYVTGAEGVERVSDGLELRNEVTSTFYFGGNEEGVYQNTGGGDVTCGNVDEDDIILPYYGLDSNYDVILPCKDADGFWQVDLEILWINAQLQHIDLDVNATGKITIHEKELLTALSSYDIWLSYEMNMFNKGNPYDIGTAIDNGTGYGDEATGLFNLKHVAQFIQNAEDGGQPRDLIALRKSKDSIIKNVGADNFADFNKEIELIYNWLHEIANTYYGKQWSVRVPFTCVGAESESGRIIKTDSPQQDGWVDTDLGVTNILGLPLDNPYITFFQNEQGKYESFCRFDSANDLDLTQLSDNEWIAFDIDDDGDIDTAFIKAQVESDWVYHDFDLENPLYPRGVVKLSSRIGYPTRVADGIDRKPNVRGMQQMVRWIWGAAEQAEIEDDTNRIAGIILNEVMEHYAAEPIGACFGVRSHIRTYGPWGYIGEPGQTRVEHVSGLVPWEYGSTSAMNTAGVALAQEGVTNAQYGEHGTITVPGYPTLPLGAELGAGGLFTGNEWLLEYRSHTSDSYNETPVGGGPTDYDYGYIDYPGVWEGNYGPAITQITTSIDPENGLTTTYQFRTFTPKFGRIAKHFAERLRISGRHYLNLRREMGMAFIQRVNVGRALNFVGNKGEKLRPAPKREGNRTPHEAFAGDITDWISADYKRTNIASFSSAELSHEIQNEYANKAFMSLEGLIRPVSMDGDGGLPPYASYGAGCQSLYSHGAMPPIYEGDGACGISSGPYYQGGAGTDEQVHQDYLNPFTNPNSLSLARSSLTNTANNRTDTSGTGHDIDIIGRGTGIPDSGMPSHMAGYSDGSPYKEYDDDYRMFALRGPLLLQSWGFDLDGKPIPNKADSEVACSGGTFESEDLQCKFLDDWLRKSHTWPVAPVDLRFDRERGVWICPPPTRKLAVRLCEDINSGSTGLAEVISTNYGDITNCEGVDINYPMVVVEDKYEQCYSSGDELIVDYDPYDCSYWILGRSSDEIMFFEMWDELERGGSATGYPRDFDAGWSTNTNLPIEFYESLNIFAKPENDSGYYRGCYGVAVRPSEACRWEIIQLEMPAEYVEFQLDNCDSGTEPINATLLDYGRGRNPEEFETWRTQFQVQDPNELFLTALSGAKGKASLDDVGEWVYNMVECEKQARMVRFTLDADLSGTPVSATLVEAYDGLDPTTLTVQDPDGLFPRAPTNAKGIGLIDTENPSNCVWPYIVIECQEYANMLEATASEFHYDDSTVSVSSVAVMHPSRDLLPSISEANNPLGWGGSGNVILGWNKTDSAYDIISSEGYWVEHMSDFKVDSGNLYEKTQEVKVMDYKDESSWVLIHEGTGCSG